MNNYYSLHHQCSYLNSLLIDSLFVSAISRKKRTLEINFRTNESNFTLLFHAVVQSAVFVQEANQTRKSNTASFFEELDGKRLNSITLDPNDRIIHINFDDNFVISMVAFGPSANAYLKKDQVDIDSFRSPTTPKSAPSFSIGSLDQVAVRPNPRDKILERNPRFPRHLIERLIQRHQLNLVDDAELCMLVDSWTNKLEQQPVYRRLSDNSLCLLDDSLIPDENDHRYTDINNLIRECWYHREIRDKSAQRMDQVRGELLAQQRKLNAMLHGLQDVDRSEQRAESHERTGHILMAYSYLGIATQELVELDDIFESGKKVQISVKKGLSFSENAQLYYVKSKNTRKSIVANKDRMVDIQRKLQIIDGMITSFQNVDGTRTLDRWLKENDDSLRQMIPLSSTGQVAARPWHTLWADGYEVWIGKSATGNDELTQAAHKEDIWMHARHVPGSHVVIRMSRRTDFPPKNVLETVAAWAAWHSKAKSAGMVPVAATKRKHVRKPKGAAPGSVLVDKEQVFLVEPVKPANDQVL